MKSAVPKVLHQAGGLPLIEHVLPGRRRPVARLHHRGRRPPGRPRAGAHRRNGWACALHCRSRSSAPATRCCRRNRCCAGSAARWCCCRATCRCCGPTRSRRWSDAPRPRAAATVLTAVVDDPHGYGRIVRDDRRASAAIVEHKDASPTSSGESRDQQRHLRVRPRRRCSTRCARSGRRTRRASTTCPTW